MFLKNYIFDFAQKCICLLVSYNVVDGVAFCVWLLASHVL